MTTPTDHSGETDVESESVYVCENCHRLGPMSDFRDECRPGWTHGRLLPVTSTAEEALEAYHEFAFFRAAEDHLPWLTQRAVARALAYVEDRHLTQRQRWAEAMARVGRLLSAGFKGSTKTARQRAVKKAAAQVRDDTSGFMRRAREPTVSRGKSITYADLHSGDVVEVYVHDMQLGWQWERREVVDIFDPDTGGVRWRDGDGREYVITPTLDGERKMRRPA